MATTFMKILVRIAVLAIALIGMNYLYSTYFYEQDVKAFSPILELVQDVPKNTKVLYLGESSNTTSREDDKDKRAISDFIDDYFPSLEVSDITKPAGHLGVYHTLLQNVPKTSEVETVIVTLNMRTFNAQCIYSHLETSLQQNLVLIKDKPSLFNRFILSFKGYDIKTFDQRERQVHKKWRREPFAKTLQIPHKDVKKWYQEIEKQGINEGVNPEITELSCNYIKAYAFLIDTSSNPRIHDLDKIITLSKKRGWNLVFNLMAENTDRAGELIGPSLQNLMSKNRDILLQYLQDRNTPVVDNLNLLKNEEYIDQNWTTEHYAEKGRKQIALQVAKQLSKLHPNHFDSLAPSRFKSTILNNCEKRSNWGQTQTITKELAYSGIKSSRVGDTLEFGLTYETNYKEVPDSLKNEIIVDLMAYQEVFNDYKAKLVIEAQGEEIEFFWEGTNLNAQIEKVKEWKKFQLHFKVTDRMRKAELIKIYVHNPSKNVVYIDDIHIAFR